MKFLVFLGNRTYSINILRKIHDTGNEIIGCVSLKENKEVEEFCLNNKIKFYSNENLDSLFNDVEGKISKDDYLLSYLFPLIIRERFIALFDPKKCINFHPGPLPEFRGVAGCCFSILNDFNFWGVTAHQLVSKVDAGALIEKITFPIDNSKMFATDVERLSQEHLFNVFQVVFDKIINNVPLNFKKQEELTKAYSRKDLEKLKELDISETVDQINKKIRGLWLPPFHGLHIEINGEKYSLINDDILKELELLYKEYNDKLNKEINIQN